MLAASTFGMISRLASAVRLDSGHAPRHRDAVPETHEQRSDQRRPAADLFLRLRFRHAFTLRQLVIVEPGLAIARIVENVDDFAVVAELQTQPEFRDARRDDVGATDKYRTHDAFVDPALRSARNALVFPFRAYTAFR